jgi:hypothetical protein
MMTLALYSFAFAYLFYTRVRGVGVGSGKTSPHSSTVVAVHELRRQQATYSSNRIFFRSGSTMGIPLGQTDNSRTRQRASCGPTFHPGVPGLKVKDHESHTKLAVSPLLSWGDCQLLVVGEKVKNLKHDFKKILSKKDSDKHNKLILCLSIKAFSL